MNPSDEAMLAPCPFCRIAPGTKVGPPALARCLTPGCEGRNLAAATFEEWNAAASPAPDPVRTAQPFTAEDLKLGEQVVMELHGITGFSSWSEHLAKVIARFRAAPQPSAHPLASVKPVAWAVLAESGNIRMWSYISADVEAFAATINAVVTPLYARAPAEGGAREGWQPIDDKTPRDWLSPILAWNSRQSTWPPVMVRWAKGDEKDGIDPYWCDAATQAGEALYYNQNYFDFWTTVAIPLPTSGGEA